MHPRHFSKHLQHAEIAAAIRLAEAGTTGQIRLMVSPRKVENAVLTAQREFVRLGLNRSPERNSVLIFVAPRARQFAVIGDEAVHARCGEVFWRELAEVMSGYFRRGDFAGGIAHGVQAAGGLLARHFPRPA